MIEETTVWMITCGALAFGCLKTHSLGFLVAIAATALVLLRIPPLPPPEEKPASAVSAHVATVDVSDAPVSDQPKGARKSLIHSAVARERLMRSLFAEMK